MALLIHIGEAITSDSMDTSGELSLELSQDINEAMQGLSIDNLNPLAAFHVSIPTNLSSIPAPSELADMQDDMLDDISVPDCVEPSLTPSERDELV